LYKRILGIDPGFTGALAVVQFEMGESARLIEVIDMPLYKSKFGGGSNRAEIDAVHLAAWIESFATDLDMCVVERVSAGPDQGVASMFRFGEGFGILRGVLAAFKLRTLLSAPSVWKPAMDLSPDKGRSLAAAKALVPNALGHLTRVKDHGRAEAILLAAYGARSLGWGSFSSRSRGE
jgi:crossover junction endodeoxyribonuclease RuvC